MSIVLIDGNHIGFWMTAISKGENDAVYKYIEKIREIQTLFKSSKLFVLWDGKSWRADGYTEYKANRDKNEALVKLKDNWKAQRPSVGIALRLMGVTQVGCPNYEADDLARLLSQKSKEEVFLITGDKDWAQLYVPGRVSWVDIKEGRRINDPDTFQIHTKSKNTWQFIQAKALTGDAGDNIPSVGDFGPKTATELFEKFGSVQSALNEGRLDKKAFDSCSSRLQKFIDSDEKIATFNRNMKLVWLSHPDVPKPEKLNIVSEKPDELAFMKFCAIRNFMPIVKNVSEWLAPFHKG